MEPIALLLADKPENWINDGLEPYQQKICLELLASGNDAVTAAETWLTACTSETALFGTVKEKGVFLNKVVEEVEKLLCGDQSYEKERRKIVSASKSSHAYFVSAISVAIAPQLGASAVFLAPVVALVLMSLGKCSLNAWCKARKVARENQQSPNKANDK